MSRRAIETDAEHRKLTAHVARCHPRTLSAAESLEMHAYIHETGVAPRDGCHPKAYLGTDPAYRVEGDDGR